MTENNKQLDEWLDSDFLLVANVVNGDIIEVKELLGLVDSFGKKKFQLLVLYKGKEKIVNLNRFQYKQMGTVHAGKQFEIQKVALNGGTALNFKPL